MAESSRKKLIVAGCSFTHGAELDHPYMSERNIELSWSQYIADHLDCELVNIALSACSNDWIFHRTIDAITQKNDIHSVIVCWTYPGRFTWRADGSIYHLQSSFFCAHKDPFNFRPIYDYNNAPKGTLIRSESQEHADELGAMHPYMIRNFIDPGEFTENQKRYQVSLTALCIQKNIKLVHTHPMHYKDIGTFDREGRHPNAEEHVEISKRIIQEFY